MEILSKTTGDTWQTINTSQSNEDGEDPTREKMIQLLTIMTSQSTVVLLDEPFAGLDDRACDYVCRWIREDSQKGRSFLIISHRLDPLESLVDYWIEMTSTGLKHLKEVSITRPLISLDIEDKTEVR